MATHCYRKCFKLPELLQGFSIRVLLGHLMECLAGLCAVLYAVYPDRLNHFMDLNHPRLKAGGSALVG